MVESDMYNYRKENMEKQLVNDSNTPIDRRVAQYAAAQRAEAAVKAEQRRVLSMSPEERAQYERTIARQRVMAGAAFHKMIIGWQG
jgi:hypothetical protein